MPIYTDNPNDLKSRPENAVLLAPMGDGTWRVYVPGDPDIPAFVMENAEATPEAEEENQSAEASKTWWRAAVDSVVSFFKP